MHVPPKSPCEETAQASSNPGQGLQLFAFGLSDGGNGYAAETFAAVQDMAVVLKQGGLRYSLAGANARVESISVILRRNGQSNERHLLDRCI